jgi:DNA-binding MarR family transcriptional regulator
MTRAYGRAPNEHILARLEARRDTATMAALAAEAGISAPHLRRLLNARRRARGTVMRRAHPAPFVDRTRTNPHPLRGRTTAITLSRYLVIHAVEAEPMSTADELAADLGLTHHAVRGHLRDEVTAGRVEARRVSAKNRDGVPATRVVYRVLAIGPLGMPALAYRTLAREGSLGTREVAKLLGTPDGHARTVLRKLVAAGLAERHHTGPGPHMATWAIRGARG